LLEGEKYEAAETMSEKEHTDAAVGSGQDTRTSQYTWQEGCFDPTAETVHIPNWLELYCVLTLEDSNESFLVAYISSPKEHIFTVQFLPENLPDTVDPWSILYRIRPELDFFLSDMGEDDPRQYLRHHCTTAANFYSQFQWVYVMSERGSPPVGHGASLKSFRSEPPGL